MEVNKHPLRDLLGFLTCFSKYGSPWTPETRFCKTVCLSVRKPLRSR